MRAHDNILPLGKKCGRLPGDGGQRRYTKWCGNGVDSSGRSFEGHRGISPTGGDGMALFNFGVLTTGFDAPTTRGVVIARPTRSVVLYSQMVGRGLRGLRSGGNRNAWIYTVVDTSLPGFRSVADAFGNWEELWSQRAIS